VKMWESRMSTSAFPREPDRAKLALGQLASRREDPGPLIGDGKHADDINCDGQAYAAVVRSEAAHGILRGIDTNVARGMPGVLGIWTGADLKSAGHGPLRELILVPICDGAQVTTPIRYPLAIDKVRFVGDPVAVVVAVSLAEARDAADVVRLDIEVLPAVTEPREGARLDAPHIFDDVPGNTCFNYYYGEFDRTVQAFDKAAHVTRLHFVSHRAAASIMTPRSVVAHYDPSRDCCILYAGSKGGGSKHHMREPLKSCPKQTPVAADHVTELFSTRDAFRSEYAALFHASKVLGRPIKWTEDHLDSLLHDQCGCDYDFDGEVALDKDGSFLATRQCGFINAGAYFMNIRPLLDGSIEATRNLATIYRMPLRELRTRIVFTNTSPLGAYPGSGRPEPHYFMERLIDTAAREMKIDPIELRKRNLIRPEDMPSKTASDSAYDSGKFTTLLDKAAEMADVAGFATRKAGSEKRGKLRGLGIGNYREVTTQPQQEKDIAPDSNGTHVAEVEVDPHTGSLEVVKYTMVNDLGAITHADDVLANNGEVGRTGALPAVMNAVVDALGGKPVDVPATPQRVWQALNPPSLLWWGID
jgi:aerobic carbon-monoxide dehydrogenase large subunit